ncbi:MAG: hypothetical protein Q7S60_00790 [bacterium]|nr:hypothetical protein [bacterium]
MSVFTKIGVWLALLGFLLIAFLLVTDHHGFAISVTSIIYFLLIAVVLLRVIYHEV